MVQINEVSTNECPVSLLTGTQFQLLQDWSESSRFDGCSLFGPDLSRWPAEVFDAFVIFASEESRIDSAKLEVDK